MLTSPMSLTITATFNPWRLFNTFSNKVVFPAPRNPESTVTGKRKSLAVSGPLETDTKPKLHGAARLRRELADEGRVQTLLIIRQVAAAKEHFSFGVSKLDCIGQGDPEIVES